MEEGASAPEEANGAEMQEMNPVLVPGGDESEPSEGSENGGMQLCAKQTTFSNLAGLIPRGYGGVNELPKYTVQSGNSITQETVNSTDALEEMRQRNAERWKQLGYDPRNGKGDMRGSATLSNFKPSQLMPSMFSKLSSITSSAESSASELGDFNASSMNSSEVPAHVLTSYSMCLKPTRQIKRVNSSGGPNSLILAESDEDDYQTPGVQDLLGQSSTTTTEKIETETPVPKVGHWDSSMLLAPPANPDGEPLSPEWGRVLREADMCVDMLGINNQPNNEEEVEYEYEEEEEEAADEVLPEELLSPEPKEEQSHETMVQSWDSAMLLKPPKHVDDIEPEWGRALREGSILIDDCSQQTSETNDQKAKTNKSQGKKKGNLKKKGMNAQRQNIMETLSKYDEDFDGDASKVPSRLWNVVTEPETSIIYRAVCGESMLEYPATDVKLVITVLRMYLDSTVNKGMIEESVYLNGIIESAKKELVYLASGSECTRVESQIRKAEDKFTSKQQFWSTQRYVCESEKEMKLQELQLKYEENVQKLDDEWNSNRVRNKYNRPSGELSRMKLQLKSLMKNHRFDEAQLLANQIKVREKHESVVAYERMQTAYNDANERLRQKFLAEQRLVEDQFERKLCTIKAQEQSDMLPIQNRMANLNHTKADKEMKARRNASSLSKTAARRPTRLVASPNTRLRLPAFVGNRGKSACGDLPKLEGQSGGGGNRI